MPTETAYYSSKKSKNATVFRQKTNHDKPDKPKIVSSEALLLSTIQSIMII